MKTPQPVGTPIDMRRFRRWLDDFSAYRHNVNEQRIQRWLEQFEPDHRDLAARVLDTVDFISNERTSRAYRSLLEGMAGWSAHPAQRRGTWRFAAFSASAGESGDEMLRRFRHANGLGSKANDRMFVHRSELLRSGLRRRDTILLVDDFAGTGSQAVDAWPTFSEVLPDGPDTHLAYVAATDEALGRISRETELIPHGDIVLTDADSIFSPRCDKFTDTEKRIIQRYCSLAVAPTAAPFSQQGLVVVFAHGCPNNSLPILHGSSEGFEGLFRRYD